MRNKAVAAEMNGGYPKNPSKVFSKAIYTGLSTLVQLARKRTTKQPKVQRLVAGIEVMWQEARDELEALKDIRPHDFSPVQSREPNMRKSFLGVLWWTTWPYGNKEFKRVYSWQEGTIGPLNELLNFAGAELRLLAITRYPFPEPNYYQIWKTPDERRIVVDTKVAKKVRVENYESGYVKAGYPATSSSPRVLLRHPSLPSLDFVDMIRAHVVELIRQCFIHNVPKKDAQRYIRLLIYRLRPFLDWVYTDGDYGRKHFHPGATQELMKIVREIRAIYSRTTGKITRLTHQLDKEDGVESAEKCRAPTVAEIVRQLKAAFERDPSDQTKHIICSILKRIKLSDLKHDELRAFVDQIVQQKEEGKRDNKETKDRENALTDRDAEHFVEKIETLSSRQGNYWHKFLFSDMYHPYSLKAAVFYGDKGLDTPDDTLIAAEVPVSGTKGTGKADIVVFVRRDVGDRAVWTPVMLLDIKTKTGIDWELLGVRPRSKKDARVPHFYLSKRSLSQEEWEHIVATAPSKRSRGQLDAYGTNLLQEYKSIIADPETPEKLYRGVVLVDANEDRFTVFDALPGLIRQVLDRISSASGSSNTPIAYTITTSEDPEQGTSPHIALVLEDTTGPYSLMEKTMPLMELEGADPFASREKDDTLFTLYLSVASSISAGPSAAWVSRNWHLLNHLREQFEHTGNTPDIVWVDLLGDLPTQELAITRLRLDMQRLSPAWKEHIQRLRGFLKNIRIVNLKDKMIDAVFGTAQDTIHNLEVTLREELSTKETKIVVIDGWADLRDMSPQRCANTLKALEHALVECLKGAADEVVWLDRPVPLPKTSATYQKRKMNPLPHNSPRHRLLDEIIWNLPTPPKVLGWKTPLREDVRVIVQDTPTSAPPWKASIFVPHLTAWAERFRGYSRKDRTVSFEEVREAQLRPMYGRGVMLSSVSCNVSSLPPYTTEDVCADATLLAPSLTRRDEDMDEVEYPETDWFQVRRMEAKDPEGYDSDGRELLRHVTFRVLGNAEPVDKDERKEGDPGPLYTSPDTITRGWRRWKPSVEEQQEKEWDDSTRGVLRPPPVAPTRPEYIDTFETRRREVIRLRNTARFLRRITPRHEAREWKKLLEELAEIAERAFTPRGRMWPPIKILRKIKQKLQTNFKSSSMWKILRGVREDVLIDSYVHISNTLAEVKKHNPDVLSLYGNHFVLLLLALERKWLRQNQGPVLTILWRVLWRWQLVQMGFATKKQELIDTKYDVHAIWSNLVWRAKVLAETVRFTRPTDMVRRAVMVSDEQESDFWMFIEDAPGSDRFEVAYVPLARGENFWGWHPAETDLKVLADKAERTGTTNETYHVITRAGGKDVLWNWYVNPASGEYWDPSCIIEYGPSPPDRPFPIRWVKKSRVPNELRPLTPLPFDQESQRVEYERIRGHLKEIGVCGERVREVECRVSLDTRERAYEIQFIDSNSGETVTVYKAKRTAEALQVLRGPLSGQPPFETEEGEVLIWDARQDVEYTDVETEGRVFSLSMLRPVVHRNKVVTGTIVIPRTADELLESSAGEEVKLVFTPERALDHYPEYSTRWRVWFLEDKYGETLLGLDDTRLSIYDVGHLIESRQLYDSDTKQLHPMYVILNRVKDFATQADLADFPLFADKIKESKKRKEMKQTHSR
ncbi:MAG: hypothetical protein GF309_15200 [Candidatus Lokiarchaeota archaeon]|nr:hypothetical protein [Candidatus Lokiarchaeota archaeon]